MGQLAFLTRALKAPSLAAAIDIRAARFPARRATEEFDFDHQRSLKRETATIWAPWTGQLQDELVKLGRIPLVIVDEVGYAEHDGQHWAGADTMAPWLDRLR